MANNKYTEDQITEFLTLAQEVGIARAIRELGYPSFPMAKRWAVARDVTLPLNELSQYANDMRNYYSAEEKLYACQLQLDRIVEALNAPGKKEADELKKLSEALKRTVETMNLIEGKATNINESRNTDGFNEDYIQLLEEQERINKAKALPIPTPDDTV